MRPDRGAEVVPRIALDQVAEGILFHRAAKPVDPQAAMRRVTGILPCLTDKDGTPGAEERFEVRDQIIRHRLINRGSGLRFLRIEAQPVTGTVPPQRGADSDRLEIADPQGP